MNASRNRKIAYLLSIVVLFTFLIALSQGIERSAEDHKLAQKSLGNINPVSGTAQLVFMGFRGVAVAFLWHDAIELKKKERWFEIRPVLESITLLQPNFVNPWTFQAWNMAYNIAAEWEAVPDKYYWIREGIDFMKNATYTNKDKCDLEWYTGWLYYNRFGMSDEKVYLREMFAKDKDAEFARSNSGINDNFKKSYDWFDQANNTIRRLQQPPKSKGITPFMSYTALSESSYADFLGKDGVFGEKGKNAWRTGHNEWLKFGREGGVGRDTTMIHRLEFSEPEWKALTEEEQYWANHYAKIVNYFYWKKRTQIEATDEMQAAREAYYKAVQAGREGDYKLAISEYEKAFPLWRKIIESDEALKADDLMREDSQENEARYLRLLSRLDLEPPDSLKPRPFDGLYDAIDLTAKPVQGRDLERPNQPVSPSPTGGNQQ